MKNEQSKGFESVYQFDTTTMIQEYILYKCMYYKYSK